MITAYVVWDLKLQLQTRTLGVDDFKFKLSSTARVQTLNEMPLIIENHKSFLKNKAR